VPGDTRQDRSRTLCGYRRYRTNSPRVAPVSLVNVKSTVSDKAQSAEQASLGVSREGGHKVGGGSGSEQKILAAQARRPEVCCNPAYKEAVRSKKFDHCRRMHFDILLSPLPEGAGKQGSRAQVMNLDTGQNGGSRYWF
jgi:hypothetical protein